MDINAEISYNWTLAWDKENMAKPRPAMNRLLKAILEKDVIEMEKLFEQGASWEAADKETFGRVLYYVLDNFKVIKCLTEHGFTRLDGPYSPSDCWGTDGYPWGLTIRAWYLKAYDVMELLAWHGFDNINIVIQETLYDGVRLIFEDDDVRAAKILLWYGYSREKFDRMIPQYPNGRLAKFLNETPVVNRKLLSLDHLRYKEIPKPQLEIPGLFNRKKVEYRNQLLLADYEDRIKAQRKLIDYLGKDRMQAILEWQRKFEKIDLTKILLGE